VGQRSGSDIPHIFQAFRLRLLELAPVSSLRSEVVAGASSGQIPPLLLMWRYVQGTLPGTPDSFYRVQGG